MKLLYITTNLNTSGGVAKILSVKLNYLSQKKSYDIHVLNTNGSTSDLFYSFNENIQMHDFEKGSSFLKILEYGVRLKRRIEELNPDVIINCDNGLKGSLLPFFVNKKRTLIYECHNSKNARARNLIDRIKLKLSSLAFSLNSYKYKWVILYQPLQMGRLLSNSKIIPNPLEDFQNNGLNTTLEKKEAIAIGRFSYQKGYDKLIQIWSLVVKKYPDWILKIYGEGNCDSFKKLANTLKTSNNIHFFKPVKDITKVYLNASMLLNTSRYEPFGLANIEAMSCGVPVIAFKNTLGPSSYIDDNKNGFLIEKDNLNEYADRIIMLIENKKEMVRISKASIESMKDFELNKVMKLWEDLFQSI